MRTYFLLVVVHVVDRDIDELDERFVDHLREIISLVGYDAQRKVVGLERKLVLQHVRDEKNE